MATPGFRLWQPAVEQRRALLDSAPGSAPGKCAVGRLEERVDVAGRLRERGDTDRHRHARHVHLPLAAFANRAADLLGNMEAALSSAARGKTTMIRSSSRRATISLARINEAVV